MTNRVYVQKAVMRLAGLVACLLLACGSYAAPKSSSPKSSLQDSNELNAKVEHMTDMIVELFPFGSMTEMFMAKDPTWPLEGRAKNISEEQLACMRRELSSASYRKSKLQDVLAYAQADRARFDADYQLLDTGVAAVFGKLMMAGASQARGGEKVDPLAFMKDMNVDQLQSFTSLVYDAKYKPLRELIGVGDAFSIAASGRNDSESRRQGMDIGRTLGMKMMFNAMRVCNVAPAAILTPEPPLVTEMDFTAVCHNPMESSRSAELGAKRALHPKPDPSSPLQVPEYPPASKRAGEEGTVMVDLYVTDEGSIAKARLKKSSGFERLDSAAISGAKEWRITPGQVDGKPACMWVTVPVIFKLDHSTVGRSTADSI